MKRSTSAPLFPELLEMEDKSMTPQRPPIQNLLSRRVTSGSIMSLPGEIVIRTALEGSPRKQVSEGLWDGTNMGDMENRRGQLGGGYEIG